MSTSSCEPRNGSAVEHSEAGKLKGPAPNPLEATTSSHSTLPERIEARRRDPEFQKRLKQNLDRHKEVLDRLADC